MQFTAIVIFYWTIKYEDNFFKYHRNLNTWSEVITTDLQLLLILLLYSFTVHFVNTVHNYCYSFEPLNMRITCNHHISFNTSAEVITTVLTIIIFLNYYLFWLYIVRSVHNCCYHFLLYIYYLLIIVIKVRTKINRLI